MDFIAAIYCWGLMLFNSMSNEGLPQTNDIWTDPQVFSHLMIWLDLNENDYADLWETLTFKQLCMYQIFDNHRQHNWIWHCNGTSSQIRELKIVSCHDQYVDCDDTVF